MVSGLDMYLFPLLSVYEICGVTTRPCGYAHLDSFLFMSHVKLCLFGDEDGLGGMCV